MKNTDIIQYIFFGIVLLLLSSCDKDPSKPGYQGKPPKPEYYRIKMNEELKSYLWSKPGSYWIYKNTKTGDLDTHIIRSFYFDSILVKGTELHTVNTSPFIMTIYQNPFIAPLLKDFLLRILTIILQMRNHLTMVETE
jgi:hypothetical protein